jgi:hypothetical protein
LTALPGVSAVAAAPAAAVLHAARAGSTAEARPLPDLTVFGVLQAPGYEDIWSFSLEGGQQAIIEMTPPEGEDFRLALFPPGTTATDRLADAVATSLDPFDPQALKYVAPPSGGGVYYIDVWSFYSSVDDGSYTLEVDIQSPTRNVKVTAPNVPSTVRVNRDYTSRGTLNPRHMPGESSVTVEWQKLSGGRWRSEGTDRVENEDFGSITRYKVEYSFFGWGSGKIKWRVRAIHRADELHPRVVSPWRYFWVKV